MVLTQRDRDIMQFINAVGWCTAPQVQRRFEMQWWIFYRLIKRLINQGWVIHKRFNIQSHGIYYLTSKGARYTDLPPVEKISKGIFDHQSWLVDLVIKLHEKHPDSRWISERHLIQEKFQYGLGQSGHISDGALILSDQKRVALELELSMKSKKRLNDILNAYATNLTYKEVWYFCSNSLRRRIADAVGDRSFIKVFSLRDFLDE